MQPDTHEPDPYRRFNGQWRMPSTDLPPAVTVHVPGCSDVPIGTIPARLRQIAADYPNGRPHLCLDQGNPSQYGVVEVVTYGSHDYRASTIAECPNGVRLSRPLCEVCRGTHAENPPRKLILVRQRHH